MRYEQSSCLREYDRQCLLYWDKERSLIAFGSRCRDRRWRQGNYMEDARVYRWSLYISSFNPFILEQRRLVTPTGTMTFRSGTVA